MNMNTKKFIKSKWILKSTVHKNKYKKVQYIKMKSNIKKFIKSKWILKSTSNQNKY